MSINVERIPPTSRVDLYVSPGCPYCRAAIAHYTAAGTAFTLHDAQNDPRERRAMFGYTAGDPTVPAIVVDGTYVQSGWGSPPRG